MFISFLRSYSTPTTRVHISVVLCCRVRLRELISQVNCRPSSHRYAVL